MDFFDTVLLHTKDAPALNKAAQAKGINLRVLDNTRVAVRERKHHASCVLPQRSTIQPSLIGCSLLLYMSGLLRRDHSLIASGRPVQRAGLGVR